MSSTVTAPDIATAVGQAFSDLDAVEGVYLCGKGPVFRLFTVINDDSEDVYDRIYEREKRIKHSVAEKLRFSVIARHGRSIGDIVGGCAAIWQRAPQHELCPNVTSI
jgi:hypothetical protein